MSSEHRCSDELLEAYVTDALYDAGWAQIETHRLADMAAELIRWRSVPGRIQDRADELIDEAMAGKHYLAQAGNEAGKCSLLAKEVGEDKR